MRRYIRELQPTSVYDLAAMVALYRPGPDGQHPGLHPAQARPGAGRPTSTRCSSRTWRRRTGSSSTRRTSWPPRSRSAASPGPRRTRSATRSARRSRPSSAPRRRSSSPRPPSAASTPQVIDAVFKAFEPFERYGFNKAHATCYGLIAYQTAYLKANYTVEYMTSGPDGVPRQRGEGRRRDRRVPPDGHRGPAAGRPPQRRRVHGRGRRRSGSGCWRSRTSARARSSRSSPRARTGGPFRSLADFCARIDLRLVNRKVLEALAKVGALIGVRPPGAGPRRGLDDAIAAGAGRRSATGSPARRRCSTSVADESTVLERPLPAARPRRRSASGCAGRRSCSGCTCRSTRWARSPSRSAQYVTAYQRRPEGRGARRPAASSSAGSSTGFRTVITKAQRDDGRRDARGPPGLDRGRRLPAAVRDRPAATWHGGRDPARRGPRRPPRRGGLAPRGSRARLGRRRPARPRGVRARGRGRRRPRRRDQRRPGGVARPDQRPDLAVRPRRRRLDGPRAAAPVRRPRSPSGSASAGRRSSSGCTSRSIRWARSPSRSASTSPRSAATSRTSRSTASGSSSAGS